MSRLRSLLRASRSLLGLAGGLALVGMSGYVFMLVASAVYSAKTDSDRHHLTAVTGFYFLVTTVIMGVYAGLDQTTNRRIAHARATGVELRPAVLRAIRDAAYLTAAVGAGLLALAPLLAPRTLHGDLGLYSALLVGICTAAAASVVRGVLAGSQRFVAYGAVWAAEGLSRIALIAAVVLTGIRSSWVFGYVYVVPFLVSALVGLVLCRSSAPGAARREDAPDGSGALESEAEQEAVQGMGLLPLAVAGLLTTAVGNLPQLVLGSRLESTELVGVAFGDAFLLARIALTALTPFQSMLLPAFTALAVTGQVHALRRRLRSAISVCAAFGAAWTLLVVGAGPWLLRRFFHVAPADVPSLTVFLVLGGGTILFAVASAVQPAIVALGHYRHVPYIWASGAVATLAGAFWPGLTPLTAATVAALAGPVAVLAAMAVSARTGVFRDTEIDPVRVETAEAVTDTPEEVVYLEATPAGSPPSSPMS